MTTELEQEFYDTFGIKPYTYYDCLADYTFYDQPCNRENCISCGAYRELLYKPEITTEKLLQMICILNKHYAENYQCATMPVDDTIEKIKECVLKDCIEQSQHIKSEIQQLFKD